MTLPVGTQTVRVFGQYTDLEGKPLKGKVVFRASVAVVGEGVVIPKTPVRVILDAQGRFSVELPTTDNAGLDPDGWTYQVDELFYGGQYRRYNIQLSPLLVEVDISDLEPVITPVAPSKYAKAEQVSFYHVQSDLATVWDLTHNMGYHPSAQITDSTGDTIVLVEIEYVSANQLRLKFGKPTNGSAYLS